MPDHVQTIGKYRVLHQLGEGATSRVYLCHDEFADRHVAVKMVKENVLDDPQHGRMYSRLFALEASLAGKLKHPHIVEIYDAVSTPDEHYVVMEYVDGTTLRPYCLPDRLLSLELIVELMFKCAMALNYVYRHGVIHRDLKPANILAATVDGAVRDVKLSDFGSALVSSADVTQVLRVGSLGYMSPEQIEGRTLDSRSDIYSLGVVMYHLVAGRLPFDADHAGALTYQILHTAPAAPSAFRHDVPAALDELILRALQKPPADRFASWDDVSTALSRLITNEEIARSDLYAVRDAERFALLRRLEFFRNFDDLELWEVVRRGHWQRFRPGQALFRKGMDGNDFHIITEGRVEVYRDQQRVAEIGAGQCVGEMAYLAPDPRLRTHSVDVIAQPKCTTVSFNPESLAHTSVTCQREFDAAFIRILVNRLARVDAGRSGTIHGGA